MGKAAGTCGVCPRKTMNIDPYRDRCSLPDLDQKKLRRVAFCVDVEIAGAAQYVEDEPEAPPPPPLNGESSLTRLEHQVEAKKKKDQKLRKGEGAALKNPDTVAEEKETQDIIKASAEEVKSEKALEPKALEQGEVKEPSRKKEKKKRSEGERKERKERKHQEALANGTIPAELKGESSSSATDSPPGAQTPPGSQDRPTTDPLRIYRRCCQLRETPILKRIVDQISSPAACHTTTPGILSSLDLSGHRMQLPDIVTLGDYLAVVPVKRLILEDCGLGDEAVRLILAGLLAAKTPEQSKHNKKLAKRANGQLKQATERLGVVEKLSLKNNPKIGKGGWRHIALFINMSRSLKAIDLSMIPFPKASATVEGVKHQNKSPTTPQIDMSTLLQDAIAERLEGDHLEELVMAECGLSTETVGKLVDGVVKCGVGRLGFANNNISRQGLDHVIRYVESGKCTGLDLGGNDLRDNLHLLADALDAKNPLWALSLADCHLSPSSLEPLLPALVRLQSCRFIDLSHNRDLFSGQPTAIELIRKYLPQFPMLKRLHLVDVAMTSEHAIALAEVLPESKTLAHLNLLDNHRLSPLASAKTEAAQEEACALYASLMAAVRVSDSIICIDIDVPTQDSSEIVKALAKQVVAYSLRNLERMPLQETSNSVVSAITDSHGGKKEPAVTVPDILLHLVGHVEGYPENHDDDEPAPDDDYIVGGTGVVKALDICLNRAADGRKGSGSPLHSGTATPKTVIQGKQVSKGKAKEMSKNLLDSARKIRARLQPALIKEARVGDEMNYSKCIMPRPSIHLLISVSERLQFLDATLERMIQRFEDEYPETRLSKPTNTTPPPNFNCNTSFDSTTSFQATGIDTSPSDPASPDLEDDLSAPLIRPSSLSRRSSSPSLASRQAQEEGRMHRFGQRVKRNILRPEYEDHAHGTTGTEVEAEYLQDLRTRLDSLEGSEIKDKVETMGPDAVYQALGATAEELATMKNQDPESWAKMKALRGAALTLYENQGSSPPETANIMVKRLLEQNEKKQLQHANGEAITS